MERAKQLGKVRKPSDDGYSRDSFQRCKELYPKDGAAAGCAEPGNATPSRPCRNGSRRSKLRAPEGVGVSERPRRSEKAMVDHEAHGGFESAGPGYGGAQDAQAGDRRIYQQTVLDTYSKLVFAKQYGRKTPPGAARPRNDRMSPFCDEHRFITYN